MIGDRVSDGRRGRVLSIRITDDERAKIETAALKELKERGYGGYGYGFYGGHGIRVPIGPWIVRAAVEKAERSSTPVVPRSSSRPRGRKKARGKT